MSAQIAQLAINGISIGAIYALVALGLVLTYKATEVLNFAYASSSTCTTCMTRWPFPWRRAPASSCNSQSLFSKRWRSVV